MLNFLTAAPLPEGAAAESAAQLIFDPIRFVNNLQYMGIGMLVIFVIIGIIMLTTMIINKTFSD